MKILIIGGTGSLGNKLVDRIMTGSFGEIDKIIIFSRDENKHHHMKIDWKNKLENTHDIFFGNYKEVLDFRIGDIRNKSSLITSIKEADIIINAAALKHVPICEYFPYEAVHTNIIGAQNIVEIIKENDLEDKIICDVSTDKACKPVNTYGMTKAIQERIILEANCSTKCNFICVRYGNVMASRGSVIPLFQDLIKKGLPVSITDSKMTRFMMSLDDAVDTIFNAIFKGNRGETYIPIVPSAYMIDLAEIMIGDKGNNIEYTGIRPGEKMHEILISEEEINRTYKNGNYFVIQSILPELFNDNRKDYNFNYNEYSSKDNIISKNELKELLIKEGHI